MAAIDNRLTRSDNVVVAATRYTAERSAAQSGSPQEERILVAATSQLSFHDPYNDIMARFMAAEIMTPAQLPSASNWSPEKRLAGAVLAAALVEVRDHHHDPAHRSLVVEDLQWIVCDDDGPPFSFIRLCHLFDLEPEWVRAVVQRWVTKPPQRKEDAVVRRFASPRTVSKRAIAQRACA